MVGMRTGGLAALTALMLSVSAAPTTRAAAESPAPQNDEIHYSLGDTPDSVVFGWRGPDALIEYGRETAYGQRAVARPPDIMPVDNHGPFWEVRLSGLVPNTTYHYHIGAGPDYVFRTAPTGSFVWDDVGDTATCTPWTATTHAQIAADKPWIVTHGGDISYANICGQPAVHQYFRDAEAWSRSAAAQYTWGNHEYMKPCCNAPAGTPPDSLANYKGRLYVPHAQSVPNDTPSQTTHPGCPPLVSGEARNSCQGEDWGWFDAGGIRFISYPEAEPQAMVDWQQKAGVIMADAQRKPTIDFIVTYGHKPAYTSQSMPRRAITAAIDALGDKYGRTRGGKYVLNVAHHIHGGEMFSAQHGVVHVTNGGGGAWPEPWTGTAPGLLWKTTHFEHLRGFYNRLAHTLTLRFICGTNYDDVAPPCALGSTMYSLTLR